MSLGWFRVIHIRTLQLQFYTRVMTLRTIEDSLSSWYCRPDWYFVYRQIRLFLRRCYRAPKIPYLLELYPCSHNLFSLHLRCLNFTFYPFLSSDATESPCWITLSVALVIFICVVRLYNDNLHNLIFQWDATFENTRCGALANEYKVWEGKRGYKRQHISNMQIIVHAEGKILFDYSHSLIFKKTLIRDIDIFDPYSSTG